ncbi:RraA family protein [Salmonella enterica subsp. enterica serovar Dortmund]|uniref:RraA family protein n=1 Tax=Salmonella enterica TaxID=28901 RepID=UPI001281AF9B|nr:RraA family protein [Salmonella enterica]EBX6017050.1 RraA family protein [Salmonella enterica subsp. enterica serovar Dortmund]ECI3851003.1 RraA family protein [Salmonella enterica subsp. enterica]EDH5633166.1 RraA family protein [Salmonella enterica subsp. enterica serovar Claibornei]EEB9696915.1 RraA family protein [Salmonella enterica subsp. enterica serovar Miami]EEE2001691.1 RraA family protein [Salmonella enterica subsp. enterica serovar Kotte]MBL1255173.1 RraA family protein [Salmo
MSNGFRVYMQRVLPNPELITAFKAIPAANIADCMGRLSAMNSTIRLQSAPLKNNMVGVALTVKVRAGDNLMVHKALNMLMPDDVLVVSNDGGNSQALMGEIMITYAQQRQASGIVLDGPVRDLYSIQGMDFPVYATGSTPAGPYKDGPGEVNVPISCGGMQVNPGDIIVGDGDGVIVIPRQDAEALLSEAQKYQLFDNKKLLATQSGNVDRSWVDKELANKNCEVINDIWR